MQQLWGLMLLLQLSTGFGIHLPPLRLQKARDWRQQWMHQFSIGHRHRAPSTKVKSKLSGEKDCLEHMVFAISFSSFTS